MSPAVDSVAQSRLKQEAVGRAVRTDIESCDDVPCSDAYSLRALKVACAGARGVEYAHGAVFGPEKPR